MYQCERRPKVHNGNTETLLALSTAKDCTGADAGSSSDLARRVRFFSPSVSLVSNQADSSKSVWMGPGVSKGLLFVRGSTGVCEQIHFRRSRARRRRENACSPRGPNPRKRLSGLLSLGTDESVTQPGVRSWRQYWKPLLCLSKLYEIFRGNALDNLRHPAHSRGGPAHRKPPQRIPYSIRGFNGTGCGLRSFACLGMPALFRAAFAFLAWRTPNVASECDCESHAGF